MIKSEEELLNKLDSLGISYHRYEHPPVYTCAEAEQLRLDLPGVSTKNLFLRDKAGRFFLVMTACEKRLNFKSLAQSLGVEKLAFASEQELLKVLGLTPGSVTVLALVNDAGHQVQLVVDADIWHGESFLCHPLVNTATLVILKEGLQQFLEATGHFPVVTPDLT